jgi:hypothetical protein
MFVRRPTALHFLNSASFDRQRLTLKYKVRPASGVVTRHRNFFTISFKLLRHTFSYFQAFFPVVQTMADYNTLEFTRYADAHKDLNGAGDARPTALQIVEDNDLRGIY